MCVCYQLYHTLMQPTLKFWDGGLIGVTAVPEFTVTHTAARMRTKDKQ